MTNVACYSHIVSKNKGTAVEVLDNLKYVEVNNFSPDQIERQKHFLSGLKNARNLLKSIEHSIQKTDRYEQQLMRCRAKHSHAHGVNEWCGSEADEKVKTGIIFTRTPVDMTQSWSTVSVVCLQYQYEELSKRYEALLKAYDERCSAVNSRDIALENLQRCLEENRSELKQAHQSLLAVGEKFLELKHKKKSETAFYEEIIISLREAVSRVVDYTERARAHLDRQLEKCMRAEKDTTKALLLAEIRKCNILYVENLRLKTCIENFEPGLIDWDKDSI